jgi:hypothetical protein
MAGDILNGKMIFAQCCGGEVFLDSVAVTINGAIVLLTWDKDYKQSIILGPGAVAI